MHSHGELLLRTYLIHKLMVDLGFLDPVFKRILRRELTGVALKGNVGGQAQVVPNKLIFELPMTLAENGLAGNEVLHKMRSMRKNIREKEDYNSPHYHWSKQTKYPL